MQRYLDQQSAKQIVHALVISRLDCCNSLLCGLPADLLNRLQRVQNACARTIMMCRKYDHITPVLKELHWLPIAKRIQFKVLMLTYKCLNGVAPQYLAELITPDRPGRELRSKTGERAFSYAAPWLWNKLPLTIRKCTTVSHFKVSLKTHLFKEHYNC